jgi:hypothetical protein
MWKAIAVQIAVDDEMTDNSQSQDDPNILVDVTTPLGPFVPYPMPLTILPSAIGEEQYHLSHLRAM